MGQKILVTGSRGFIGKNLISLLETDNNIDILTFDRDSSLDELAEYTKDCDAVIHLAGINRPENPAEFYEGNASLTDQLCAALRNNKNTCPVVLSSSVQVAQDNDYGKSKKMAEEALLRLSEDHGNKVCIYRFKNLYGKWSRPNYNSVVATWCYNISRGIEIRIDKPDKLLELCYIDDVIDAILDKINRPTKSGFYEIDRTSNITLSELKDLLESFHNSRNTYTYPNQDTYLNKTLYATYLNYLPAEKFSYKLDQKKDDRGSFAEILKCQTKGQVSVNISKPGITKGQHWHRTKNEKFLIVSGKGTIQLRDYFSKEVIEYNVSDENLEVVDIPTGYIHNLINKGDKDMVTLIWANEPFDNKSPDTNSQEV